MSDAKRLFGTDGIRGLAGKTPLTSGEVLRLGRAAGRVLRDHFGKGSIRVVGVRDTRRSGPSILSQLFKGLREQGIDVYDAGVLNTPAVAYLVRTHSFQSGVVISASHNPPEFNGIKFFTSEGCKWPDAWERQVEELFASSRNTAKPMSGKVISSANLASDYEDFLVQTLPAGTNFKGLRVGMDCSHGANSGMGPRVFERLGAQVFVIGCKPNGKNINVNCGSQHTEKLGALVRKRRCHLGVAFDGDADRVIFTDEKGAAMDGDQTIAVLARHLKAKKILKGNRVVITVMANLGLKKALASLKIKTEEVAVGDRYVSEAMRKHGAVLGGEQSGHIIMGQYLPTGDGLLTAVHMVSVLKASRQPVSQQIKWMRKFPQVLINVRIRERIPLPKLDGVAPCIDKVEKHLGSNGRVLVRYSGTEPLLRIMLEGPKKSELESFAAEIANRVRVVNGA